ncbi:MAG: L-threonylcarbamoyladenylate synthase [Myxococcota bacterium]
MRIVTAQYLEDSPEIYDEAVDVLREGGLVCFPGHRQYSIAASLLNVDAVIALVQSKHRSGKTPSLVLIPEVGALEQVVEEVPDVAYRLARAFWPGPLTLLLRPSSELPSKVRKTITPKKPARIGVRVPGPGHQSEIVQRFGGPLLISSANLANKVGASSASHVRKNFNHTVDLMIDAGDVPEKPPSTIVDLLGDIPKVTRVGQVSEEAVAAASATEGISAA